MVQSGAPATRRRDGASTRQRAIRVALQLFTEQGYEATSLRQIADALGINKASLYYHFPSKEAILHAAFEQRGAEAAELLEWFEQQARTPALVRATVLRWVDSFSEEKLQGIRFLRGNPFIGRILGNAEGDRIGDALERLSGLLAGLLPDSSPEKAVLVRMALLSINAAVEAGIGTGASDAEIVGAARVAADAVLRGALEV